MSDSTKRFSNRVSDYIKYRPSYPKECIDYLQHEIGLAGNSVVADVGSGTGIFTSLLLPIAGKVYAVEPNKEMRLAAEELLKSYPNFVSVNGSSTATALKENSVDIITAAQAFHWFDIPATLQEFRRIGKVGSKLVLIWNNRKLNTPFLAEYDHLLKQYANDYNEVNHQNLTDELLRGCFAGEMTKVSFPNHQNFDFEGLKGRMLSSSYCPKPNEPNYKPLMTATENAFNKFAVGGKVTFRYDTEIYWGEI